MTHASFLGRVDLEQCFLGRAKKYLLPPGIYDIATVATFLQSCMCCPLSRRLAEEMAPPLVTRFAVIPRV